MVAFTIATSPYSWSFLWQLNRSALIRTIYSSWVRPTLKSALELEQVKNTWGIEAALCIVFRHAEVAIKNVLGCLPRSKQCELCASSSKWPLIYQCETVGSSSDEEAQNCFANNFFTCHYTCHLPAQFFLFLLLHCKLVYTKRTRRRFKAKVYLHHFCVYRSSGKNDYYSKSMLVPYFFRIVS